MPPLSPSMVAEIRQRVNPRRLLETATALIEIPSPTRSAGAVADRLAEILTQDGFSVERPVANWPEAPAVVVRWQTGKPGRLLQFDGHLDTVHLPFVPPAVVDDTLTGSGCADMKGGIAAFVEALRALRESGLLQAGGILLTAHDHHEGPWGDRRQVEALIREGYVGDAVMLPEYLADRLPVAGRGMGIFEVSISRDGEPVHEVLRPHGLPNVLEAGVDLVMALRALNERLARITADHVGTDSVFVGQLNSGEIFNQAAVLCTVKGTRRWVTPGSSRLVQAEFRQILSEVAERSGTRISADFAVQGDAMRIDPSDPLLVSFQTAYSAISGAPLPVGNKPFVDDGNTFVAQARVPALTHGPAATGAHTLHEAVSVAELVRVAQLYALTAVSYCATPAV